MVIFCKKSLIQLYMNNKSCILSNRHVSTVNTIAKTTILEQFLQIMKHGFNLDHSVFSVLNALLWIDLDNKWWNRGHLKTVKFYFPVLRIFTFQILLTCYDSDIYTYWWIIQIWIRLHVIDFSNIEMFK